VYRREPLSITATGDRVSIATRLQYRARVGLPGARIASCGYAPQPMRRASLLMSTSLYWRRDWRIGARQTSMQATLDDECRVTALSLDATPALRNIIDDQLQLFATQADSAIPLVADLKPLADSLWRSFVEPTPLDSAGLLWLMLEPEAVRVAPLQGIGPSFRTAITLYARPRVVAGAKPTVRMRALPELSLSPAPANFEVPLTVELPFAELERRTTALLVAQTRESSVRVDSVHLSGRGDSVRVELDVSGGLRGRLALVSKMRWDAVSRELRLDELNWTLDSKGALARVKASMAAPLIGRALRRATMGGRVPLGAQLDSARTQLLGKVNATLGPGVAIGGSVGDVQIISMHAVEHAFVVRARFTGQAGVWIQ
jgi:hypothetical protein